MVCVRISSLPVWCSILSKETLDWQLGWVETTNQITDPVHGLSPSGGSRQPHKSTLLVDFIEIDWLMCSMG